MIQRGGFTADGADALEPLKTFTTGLDITEILKIYQKLKKKTNERVGFCCGAAGR